MRTFTKETAEAILTNQIDPKTLAQQYPELQEAVVKDFSEIGRNSSAEEIAAVINTHKAKARLAMDRIRKSGGNQKTINAFLPDIIRARIAIHTLEQAYMASQSGRKTGKVRLNLWDGSILQQLLFKSGFERKPVNLLWFRFWWLFITNKKILMPLVNEKGIYCFYSKPLIRELCGLIGTARCLEIGAGDGTLTRFLGAAGTHCDATDDYSWEQYIRYPDYVERLDARESLKKYRPEVVICSWPPPGNAFEKVIFKTDSVKLYIVIGSRNPLFSGDHDAYQNQEAFTLEHSQRLADLVLPPSDDNAVYIFRRKTHPLPATLVENGPIAPPVES